MININVTIILNMKISNAKIFISIISFIDFVMKHVQFNDVIIYEKQKTANKIENLIAEYQNVFMNKNITMNVFEKQ